jgi:hypothetical protein
MRSSTTTWPTFEAAKAAALKEAAKHTGWSSARVYIDIGSDEGEVPKDEQLIRVDVIRHDERAPDEVVEWHEYNWKRE